MAQPRGLPDYLRIRGGEPHECLFPDHASVERVPEFIVEAISAPFSLTRLSVNPGHRVTLLVPNLSGNNMYRTFLLYRALERDFDVEIVGFLKGPTLWEPLRSEGLKVHGVPLRGWPGFVRDAFALLPAIRGSVVIACKPRITSYGVALLKRWVDRTPVVLDVDDDELAMTRPPETTRLRTIAAFNARNPDAYWSSLAMHRLRSRANAVFCVSEHFRSTYGGTLVPHGRDPRRFDPALYDPAQTRRGLGIDGKFVVVFVGTVRPHKGLEPMLEGLARAGIPNAVALVVGAPPNDPYVERLRQRFGSLLLAHPTQAAERIPALLAAADTTVLAQARSAESLGQLPAKLTDAMLMGLPVIATRISDIPKYVDGCGLLVDEPDPQAIGEALAWIAAHPDEAKALGRLARQRALALLTEDAMRERMRPVIEGLMPAAIGTTPAVT